MKSYKQKGNRLLQVPKAKRSLGQNFLQDANIARKIVQCLEIVPEDSILEIGPGQGALTRFLQETPAARLVLVEKDHHWASERMRQGGGVLSVILADALALSWERFLGPWKFIGNLPYNVASPLMWDICATTPALSRAVFMVQKEVALRVTAKPGSSAYGALSVWVQSFMRPKLEFTVPPQVFRPRPKVDSAVLSFTPLPEDAGKPAGEKAFSRQRLSIALKSCFQMRRKQLGSIVRAFGHNRDVLLLLGIDPGQRPEDLTPQDFHRLSENVSFTSSW